MTVVNTGQRLEAQVADAYRRMGATRVEHDVSLAGNQIDLYVELAMPGHLVHRIAVDTKDWKSPVGIDVVNGFGQVVKLLHSERLVDEGLIVSTAGFSRPAREAALTHGVRLLEPSDLEAMAAEAVGGRTPSALPLAGPLPPVPYLAHPYPMQKNFTGRALERQMLTEWWLGEGPPVLAVTAIGGMGKSALTWAWLHQDVLCQLLPGVAPDPPEVGLHCRVRTADRPEGILWWSFYEADAKFSVFLDRALVYVSRGDTSAATVASTHDRVRSLVRFLQERRFLLILDGFERELRAFASLSAAYQGDDVIEDVRSNYRACTDPHASDLLRWVTAVPLRSRILLTSRLFPRELDGVAACRRIGLAGLDPEDAEAFFRAQGVQGSRAEIEAVGRSCGYHPLALRLLAGMIVHDPARPGDIAVASDYSPIDELVSREHHILALAYNSLDPTLRAFLSRLAAFRTPVTYEVAAILSPFHTKRDLGLAFRELMNRGLLFFDEEGLRYDLHPIVRRYAYRHLDDREGVHNQLRTYLASAPTPDAMEVNSVEDLAQDIELYHHTVRAARYEDALDLYRDRLADPLFYRLGAYQVEIDLLRALFDDEAPSVVRWTEEITGLGGATLSDRSGLVLPRLREARAQAWTLNALASSYSRSGQPRRAVPLLEMHSTLREKLGERTNLAIGLKNLASVQLELGELAAAERYLRRSLANLPSASARESLWSQGKLNRDEGLQASVYQELGHLQSIQGAFDQAGRNLDRALEIQEQTGHVQSAARTWAYRAQRALLMGEPGPALGAAQTALQRAEEATESLQFVYAIRDLLAASWLLGAACLELGRIDEAEVHLGEVLTRCRRINLVELEPSILLSWARWQRHKSNWGKAREAAEEALSIADRGEYRLRQAEALNFLARWEREAGSASTALQHADRARERAWCDGPPHCYKPALQEAERLLASEVEQA